MRTILATLLVLAAACGPSGSGDGDAGGDDDPGTCTAPATRCSGNTFQSCSDGAWVDQESCPDACDDRLGCVLCVPGTGTCEGMTSHACRPDGQGFFDEFCDPVMGSTCNPDSGICEGACAAFTLGQSYIGCDYYPTQSSQLVNPSFQFAVAVSNTSGSEATVTIDGGALGAPMTVNVAPGAVAVQYLPWVPALKRCMTQGLQECGLPESYGALAVDGAYHLRSNRPVTVYQFSALDYAFGGGFSYSNDASLLLPTNVWTGNYVVPAWQTWDFSGFGILPGTMAITAQQDNTMVQVTSRATTTGGDGAPSFSPGAPQTVALNSGDVLMLMSTAGDLTGSTVTADKAVQVVAGHHCTQVPIGFTACDHVEESIFPVEALSTRYLVTAPLVPSGTPRTQITRITAAETNTSVTVDPAVAGPFTLANIGDFVEVSQVADMYITADNKIMVTHYMVGQDAPPAAGIGDPAMTLAVPTDQYRTSYQFHAPINYDNNYVNITAPTGTVVMLDGVAVPGTSFTAIGGSGLSVARVALADNVDGNHVAESNVGFGVTVYGYGQYTSYWYPGGLDLATIPVD